MSKGTCSSVWEAEVVEVGTAEAIPEAQVILRPSGAAAPIYARTTSEGQLQIDGLCPGTMSVRVSKAEHSPAQLAITLGPTLTRSRIELEPLHDHHSHRVIVVHDEGLTHASASESLAGADLARSRGQNLSETLTAVSGVAALRGTAGGMGKPIIRGQFGRRTMILVDGIRHEGQDWGIDHAPEVDPYSADRITVIKGAQTTRFGAKAIGGVVILEPRPLPRSPGLRAEVSTVGATNPLGGGGSARIDYAPRRGRGFAMRLAANASRHRAGVSPTYPLDNTGALTWNVGGLVGYASDAVDLGIGYHLVRARSGICACLRTSTPEEFQRSILRGRPVDADLYRAVFPIDRAKQEIWHHLTSARARIRLGEAGELHALYAFQFNDRREFDVVRRSVTGPQLTFGLATHSGDLRYEHPRYEFGDWALVGTTGAVASHQTNEFRSSATLIPDYQQTSWALYDVERLVHERVELEVGARYEGMHRLADLRERNFLSQQASGRLDTAACVANPGSGGTCEHTFHAASATIGALLRPFGNLPRLTWRLQLSSSARMPSIDEHFMNGAAPSFPILGLGTSTLGIERSWGGESTLHYDGDWLTVEAAAYTTSVDNYIYFVPEPQEGQCAPLSCTTRGPLPVFVFRPTDALFGGAEARFDLRAPRLPFGLHGDAAWIRAIDRVADAPLALLPTDRYTLAGRYYLPETWPIGHGYLELNGIAVARQRRFRRDLDFADPPPAYVLLGAAAGLEFMAERHFYRVSVVGTNLLNARYRDYTSLLRYYADELGWALQLRFSVDFDNPLEERPRRRSG